MSIYTVDYCKEQYEKLIEENKNTPKIPFKTERHHIVPVSLGGGDEDSNLVNLSHRSHFMAHFYLYKIHKGPMTTAIFIMIGKRQGELKFDDLILQYIDEYVLLKEDLCKMKTKTHARFVGFHLSYKFLKELSTSKLLYFE